MTYSSLRTETLRTNHHHLMDNIFAIEISSADESDTSPKQARDRQTEVAFLEQKASWSPKVEDGKLWQKIVLPIDNPSKPESQTILHSIEELYFLRKYDEASKIIDLASKGQLSEEFRKLLNEYLKRCRARLEERQP